jgi:hypothetical protein
MFRKPTIFRVPLYEKAGNKVVKTVAQNGVIAMKAGWICLSQDSCENAV